MKIVCTICSRHKREDKKFLPARVRYTSARIQEAEKIATDTNLPFFILSGKYGLISSEQEIPNYDYLLEESNINNLVKIVCEQIKRNNITEIDFYSDHKDNCETYEEVINKSVNLTGVILNIKSFANLK